MKPGASRSGCTIQSFHGVMAILCVALFGPANSVVAQTPEARAHLDPQRPRA